MDLIGKVAIVTGSSKGIGAAIAIELAKLGANVVINYKSDKEGAADVLGAVRDAGGIGSIACGDISGYEEAAAIIDRTIEVYGRIDILVNNAGISKTGLFIDMTEKDWDEIMDVNLKGIYNCTHNALRYMLPQRSGTIVNISSIWGEAGASCEVIYSAAKGGVNSFTRALSKELAPNGIRVNAVSPGVIDTRMNGSLSEEERKSLECQIPMGYFGRCAQVAKVVAFLCLDSSDYVTGQIINVDGGFL
ncbi:MAG: SDR family oxidoreductase [Clostridiaceae bacterium]